MAKYEPFYNTLNVVIDIETLGVDIVNGAPITQLAGAYLTLGAEEINIETVSVNVDSEECCNLGLEPSESTLQWMETVPPEVIDGWFTNIKPINEALEIFEKFISDARAVADAAGLQMLVFGNSPRFDFNMIDHLYRVVGKTNTLWSFREEGDYRTLCRTFPPTKDDYHEAEAIASEMFPSDGLHSGRWDSIVELLILENIATHIRNTLVQD